MLALAKCRFYRRDVDIGSEVDYKPERYVIQRLIFVQCASTMDIACLGQLVRSCNGQQLAEHGC
jgi:hypothetical protein